MGKNPHHKSNHNNKKKKSSSNNRKSSNESKTNHNQQNQIPITINKNNKIQNKSNTNHPKPPQKIPTKSNKNRFIKNPQNQQHLVYDFAYNGEYTTHQRFTKQLRDGLDLCLSSKKKIKINNHNNSFKIVPIPPDGNCLFRAVAEAVQSKLSIISSSFNDQSNDNNPRIIPVPSLKWITTNLILSHSHRDKSWLHSLLRQEISSFIKAHREDFEPFIDTGQTFNKYVASLATEGVYGGLDCLVACVRRFKLDFHVHEVDCPPVTLLVRDYYCDKGQEQEEEKAGEGLVNQQPGGGGGGGGVFLLPEGSGGIHLAYHNQEHYSGLRELSVQEAEEERKEEEEEEEEEEIRFEVNLSD